MSDATDTGRAAKRELWRHEVERWQQSGLSMRAFCRQENISYYGLRYWKEQAWAETSRAVKVSVPVPAEATATENAIIEVVVAERFRVRIPEGVRSGELERVIRCLEAVR